MLDLSAAFDTLDHSVLLNRLEHRFGVNGTVLQWFNSYLSDRTQTVVVDSYSSMPSELVHGVPQGSVLGPLLFTLYIAPLEEIFRRHGTDYMLYADDSQLYVICDRPSDSIATIEGCFAETKQWMQRNVLALNLDKTELIHFYSTHKKDVEKLDSVVKLGGADIAPTTSVRDLGVVLHQTGMMTLHINSICKSSYFALHRIGKIRSMLDKNSTEKLVHAFITSRLDYCNSVLQGCPCADLKKLQSVQNAAARLIMRCNKSDHISPILFELHWLPIKERIIFKVLLIVFKILNNQAPDYLSELVGPYESSRANLRSSDQRLLRRVDTSHTNKTYGWRAFSVHAPFLWN